MTDDPLQTLRDARDAARRGAHAEALEKYLWFHHHALEHRPSLTGVRLSYAISEWVELGNAYPPAREALESIQNNNLRFGTSAVLNSPLPCLPSWRNINLNSHEHASALR